MALSTIVDAVQSIIKSWCEQPRGALKRAARDTAAQALLNTSFPQKRGNAVNCCITQDLRYARISVEGIKEGAQTIQERNQA